MASAEDDAAALEQLEMEIEALRYTYEEGDHVAIACDQGVATLSFVARPRGATAVAAAAAAAGGDDGNDGNDGNGDDDDDDEATIVPRSNHFVEADLVIVASVASATKPCYPHCPPTVRLAGARGLGDTRARALVAALEAEASSLAAHGEPALGALVERARDLATAADTPLGDCPICLEPLPAAVVAPPSPTAAPSPPLARLGCFHALHAACLVRWYRHAQADLSEQERALAERVRSSAAAAALARETLPPRDALGGRALRSAAPTRRRQEMGEEEADEGDEEGQPQAAPTESDPYRLDCPSCRAPFSVAHVVAAKQQRGREGDSGGGGGGNDDGGAAATRALWRLLGSPGDLAALAIDDKASDDSGWADARLREDQARRAAAFERQRAAGGTVVEELSERQRLALLGQQREREEEAGREEAQREEAQREAQAGAPTATAGGGGRGGARGRRGGGGGGRGGGRGQQAGGRRGGGGRGGQSHAPARPT